MRHLGFANTCGREADRLARRHRGRNARPLRVGAFTRSCGGGGVGNDDEARRRRPPSLAR